MDYARDLGPKLLRLTWQGEELELKFNNNAMRIAEDVYDEEYGKLDCSWTRILIDLSKGKTGAVMAVYFAALKATRPQISWQEFSDKFQLTDIPEVAEKLAEAVEESLPKPEPGDEVPNA
ncbi:MAG: hypothetical protein J6U72_05020 [Clostridia bacterium]|nr:hypothetical protein [Clostridia bacterium]